MNHRFRYLRTSVTLVTSSLLCVSAVGLAAGSVGTMDKSTNPPKPVASVDAVKTVDKPIKATPALDAASDRPKRVRLSPAQTAPKGHVNPFLKEQKKLVVDARAAFQVDPVTGVGMMLSPEGSPVLINLRRSQGTSAWVGEAMGDERSHVFVVSTKHGYVGTIWSKVWGSFYFLPDGIGQATIRSSKEDERGICGNGTEWERPIVEPQGNGAGGAFGGLAGGDPGECWVDTEDQTTDGIPLWVGGEGKLGSGLSPIQGRTDGNGDTVPDCLGDVEVRLGADRPDYTITDPNCTDFPIITSVIDILYGYSQDALECLGNEAAMEALAIAEIELMNEVMYKSKMGVKARLVGVELGIGFNEETGDPEPYEGTFAPDGDLVNLYAGVFPEVRGLENLMEELRDERGADIVSLLVCNNTTPVAGIAANIPTAEAGFIGPRDVHLAACVMTVGANLSLTYQHELGHLLGGCHGHPDAAIEGAGEATCPCPDGGDECEIIPIADGGAIFQSDEYHYGYRFEEEFSELPPTDNILQSVMAYDAADQPSERVPYFSNPNVVVENTNSDTGVENEDLVCCQDSGENAANALVMQFLINQTIEAPIGAPIIPPFPGIAQYRCKTIPYDCNQNGRLDTEEMDGLWPNEDGLVDVDGDRIADGCLAKPCIIDTRDPADQDTDWPVVAEELSGPGGGILDFATFESPISIIYDPVGQPDQLAWAYQPTKVTLRGLTHTNLRDLSISLIHREPNREDTVWDLASCGNDLSGDGSALVLSGNYQFIAPTDPSQQTFLENKTICQVAQAGGIGGVLVPSGRYRPLVSLTSQMSRRQLGGQWILQITDTGNGATGALEGWDLELVTFPFDQDCNGDGEPDICTDDDAQFGTGDCDGNGISDQCEIANDPTLDCNLNGRLDLCEDLGFFDDCDEDDVIDICQIAADPGLDSNNNFILDACEDLGDDCEVREYGSLARANSGPAANFTDLSMIQSVLVIESEEDTDGAAGDNTEVHPGSLITGGVEITIAGLEHENLNEISLRLTHTAPNGISVTVPLVAVGCNGQGYLGDTGDIIFRDLGPQRTICEQASTTPGPIPAGDYLPESSLFGFFGMQAAGEWVLELYDIGNGGTGSIDSWDISFTFSPPDNDFNGVPDICEP